MKIKVSWHGHLWTYHWWKRHRRTSDWQACSNTALHNVRFSCGEYNGGGDEDKSLLARSSLDIPLVEETQEDVRLAGLLKYSSTQCKV